MRELDGFSVVSEHAECRVEPSVRAPWGGTVLLLMIVVATGHFNRIGISVAGAERIIPRDGIAPEDMGMVYSAFLVIYTLAMLPGGWFIDRFGARAALVLLGLSSTIFVALTGAVGLATHETSTLLLGLIMVRGLLGLTNAPLHPASARMVFDRVPGPSRGFANGLVTFAACLGIAVCYYLMGKLIDLFDWPIAFFISSGLTLVVALLWTFRTRASGAPRAGEATQRPASFDLSELLPVVRRRSVICIALSYSAYGYFQYLFFYWIEYYFEQIQHQGVEVARWYSTMITLAMGVGMLGGGWLADRVPRSLSPRLRLALVPVLGMIASGLVFELGLFAPTAQGTLIAFVVAAGLLGLCEAGFWTTVVELGDPFGGTAAGLMNTGGNAGGTLSPYLTPLFSGWLTAHFGADLGWRLSLAIAGAVVIAGAALWCGVSPPGDSDPKPAKLNLLDLSGDRIGDDS
jgi:MFS transporter, ACS family, D-galactonate transporter